jgi:hypothetical protein
MAVETPDVVTTAEEAAGLALPPLIIRDNLERYLAEQLPAAARSSSSESVRDTRTSPSS